MIRQSSMVHRAVVAAVALAVMLGVALVVPTPRAVNAAFATSCVARNGTNWSLFKREFLSGARINAVKGRSVVKTPVPCTPSSDPYIDLKFDYPIVLPTTIEYGDGQRIVQLGYLKCTLPAGYDTVCGDSNIPVDGKPHFVLTFNDDEEGALYNYDLYYGKSPIVGHTYDFYIYQSSNIWHYCLRDVGMGEAYFCKTRAASWADGSLAWWGTETQVDTSQQGGAGSGSPVQIKPLQYRRGSTWHTVTDQEFCWYPGGHPSYYVCFPSNGTYTGDTLNSYTLDH